MKEKNIKKGKSVLYIGTISACICYILAGVSGYITFSSGNTIEEYKAIFLEQNILMAPYSVHNETNDLPLAIYFCLFGILIVVIFATPFCILPCKDSIEDIRGHKFKPYENFVWTLGLILTSLIVSLVLLNIGTIMTILGATTNSAIGFLLPILFYLRTTRKAPPHRTDRVMAKILFVFIVGSSIITLGILGIKLTK